MRIYWLPIFEKGKIGMMARPRGNEWLSDEVFKLKNYGVDCVVSLLTPDEIMELELDEEKAFCQELGINFINFPIEDRSIPKQFNDFIRLISLLENDLKAGQRVVIHCRMGIGRTALVTAAILLRDGIAADEVFAHLSKVRGLSMPDTEEQKLWIKKWELEIRNSRI
ncbi:MAG: dual specificity protein phosphatase family protein [Bacteroidota bacterium]